MTGEIVLGGVAALLAFWMFMSALEGLGYAAPLRPSVIVPERWGDGARVLLSVIVFGLAASLLVPVLMGQKPHLSVFHLLIAFGVALPIWEIVAARMYGDSFVVVNGRQDLVRPAIIESVRTVFGDVFEEDDMLWSVEPKGKDWQLIPHDRQHLLVLDPHYIVPRRDRRELEHALTLALKTIKPAGFNVRSFWISFFLPLWFVALYAWIADALLHSMSLAPLRGTFGG